MGQMSSLGFSIRAAAEEVDSEAEAEQAELTIRQMARRYGVSLRTLRFYEARGLLAPRRELSLRFYGIADRTRMEMILQGKKLGFTLAEINELIVGKGANDNAGLEVRLQPQQISNQIGYLERQRDQIEAAILRLRETQSQMA